MELLFFNSTFLFILEVQYKKLPYETHDYK